VGSLPVGSLMEEVELRGVENCTIVQLVELHMLSNLEEAGSSTAVEQFLAAPELVAPELVAPELVAPELVAPELVAPELVAPELVVLELVALELVTPAPASLMRCSQPPFLF